METSSPTTNASSIPEALAQLTDSWDLIESGRKDGALLFVFRERLQVFERVGDAVVMVRMSKRDLNAGETVRTQLDSVLAFAIRQQVRVGHLVIATECSGGRSYWARPDFAVVERLIAEGRCRGVVWRDVTRMARDRQAFLDHWGLLEETRTRLLVELLGGEVEWGNPAHTLLGVLQLEFAIIERDQTFRRTQSGIRHQCIFNGKGIHSGTVRLGFMKDADGWLVVDPKTWGQAKLAHLVYHAMRSSTARVDRIVELFAEAGHSVSGDAVRGALGRENEACGLRSLSRVLALVGIERSKQALNRILRDSIYVDGRFWTRYAGVQIEMKPVEVSDPLPREVFADNQGYLDLADGAKVRAQIGTFAFKRRVTCGVCGGELAPRYVGERAVYYHREAGASGACLGLAIDVAMLDPLVIRHVRRVESCAEYRREAFDLAVASRDADSEEETLPYANLPELERALAGARAQLAAVAKSVAEDPRVASADSDPDASRLVAGELMRRGAVELSDEIERITRAVMVAGPIADHRSSRHPRIAKIEADVSAAFLDLVRESEPTDHRHLAKRARALEAAVSRIVVTPMCDGDRRELRVRVEGARGPRHRELAYPTVPSTAARDVLRDHIQTVKSSYDYETVRMMFIGMEEYELREHFELDQAREERLAEVPDWIVEFTIDDRQRLSRRHVTARKVAAEVTASEPASEDTDDVVPVEDDGGPDGTQPVQMALFG